MSKYIPYSLVSFLDLESGQKISNLITKYKVRILYEGVNRNDSFFSKEVADEMGKTIGGVPIIGYFSDDTLDFTGHSGEIKTVENGNGTLVEVVSGTVPYGFVPTTATTSWEKHTDKDGVTRSYLTTYAYLWEGRYPQLTVLHRGDKANNLSMELNPDTAQGTWKTIEDASGTSRQVFAFTKAEFIGLCILGKDVEPCFEGAAFDPTFSLKTANTYKEALLEMSKELEEVLKTPTETTAPAELTENACGTAKKKKTQAEEEEEKKKKEAEEEQENGACGDSKKKKKTNCELETELTDLQGKYEKLTADYNALTNDYKAALANLDSMVNMEKKAAYLSSMKNDIDADAYERFHASLDSYTLGELKTEVERCGFDYYKNLYKKNVALAATDYQLDVNSEKEESTDETPLWVKSVIETQKSLEK